MRRSRRILLTLLVSISFLTSMLAVCNAHFAETAHEDCPECVVRLSSRRDAEAPLHLPAGSPHCPDYLCAHLHLPFVTTSSVGLPPLTAFWCWLLAPPSGHGQEALRVLLKPPQS